MELSDNNRGTYLERLADTGFFILLLTTFLSNHSIIGQAGLFLFMLTGCLLMFAKQKIHASFYFIFMIVFIVYNYQLIRMGVSIDPSTSMAMIRTLILNYFFGFMLFNYLVIRDDLRRVLKLYLYAALIFTFVVAVLSGGNIFGSRLGDNINFTGGDSLYNSNLIAIVAAFAYLIALYIYTLEKKRRFLWSIIWLVLIVLLTGSRKGIMMIIMETALLRFWLYPKKRIQNLLIFAVMGFVICLALMSIPLLYQIAGSRFEALLNVVLNREIEDASTETRLGLIRLGWSYFQQRPWTGYGLDCFRYLLSSFETYSHNNYIEMLVSGGIIGFISYYLPNLVILLKILFKSKKAHGLVKVVLILFLVQQAMEFGMVTYYERAFLMILIFSLASFKLQIKNKQTDLVLLSKSEESLYES